LSKKDNTRHLSTEAGKGTNDAKVLKAENDDQSKMIMKMEDISKLRRLHSEEDKT
jgi:hypothetical protein